MVTVEQGLLSLICPFPLGARLGVSNTTVIVLTGFEYIL